MPMRADLACTADFLLIPSDDCGYLWQRCQLASLVGPYETVQIQNTDSHGGSRDLNVRLLSFGVSAFHDGE